MRACGVILSSVDVCGVGYSGVVWSGADGWRSGCLRSGLRENWFGRSGFVRSGLREMVSGGWIACGVVYVGVVACGVVFGEEVCRGSVCGVAVSAGERFPRGGVRRRGAQGDVSGGDVGCVFGA